jgi:hypothetical protein
MRSCRAVLVVALAAAGACGPNERENTDADPSAPDAPPMADAPLPPFMGAVFAHSYFNLYKVDPDTLEVMLIGPFNGATWPGGEMMTDIAVDRDESIVGITFGSLYAVDKMTAECTFITNLSGTQFNGLTFRPNPPGDDILVGTGLDGRVWQIDKQTGAQTEIGQYGGAIISSGDMVSIENYGTIATVKSGSEIDYLARIDDATGAATIIGSTGYADIWGVGYWRNKAFGFVATNEFVLIDVASGAATFIVDGPENWTGAGVTTRAPIEP